MGDTSTAVQTQSGVRVGLVLAIEGYPYLLCDTLDVDAVVDAWAGTGWTKALPGLKVRGSIRQSITPWATAIDVPTLTFEVQSTQDDKFGIAVWKAKPTFRTSLSAPYEAAADGSGTMTVAATGGWSIDPDEAEAENVIYVGSRRMRFVSATATTFNMIPAGSGTHQPFAADVGNHYSDAVSVPAQQNWDAAQMPKVQNIPPAWIGKKVALYLHRIVGDRWDRRAEAQLEFAGSIAQIDDDPVNGATVIGCEDLRGRIRDCVLLKRQWVGRVRSGIRLETGVTFDARERSNDATTVSTASAGLLTVVASGATGNDEVNAGYYELGDFLGILNKWLSNSATLAADWKVKLATDSGSRRLAINVKFAVGGNVMRQCHLLCSDRFPLEFLGFDYSDGGIHRGEDKLYSIRFTGYGSAAEIVSAKPPFVTKPFQEKRSFSDQSVTVDLESTDGDWISHADLLPSPFDAAVGAGEDWSFLRLGDRLFFGRLASATQLQEVSVSVNFAGFAAGDSPDGFLGRTVEDDDERLDVFQVVVVAGTFTDIVTKLIASTDGRGVNHATFDTFAKGMGCPGIPWSLLGDPWLDSVKALDQTNAQDSIMVVLDRPRKLVDVLLPELLLRFAWFVFKDGTYRLVAPPTPNPIAADHVLDETNKAGMAGQADMLIASMEVTKRFLCNVIKVEYNRTPDGKFRDVLTVRDETSVSTHGETQACTISAVNSYSDSAGTGAAVEALAASLVARVLPAFGNPMRTIRRTIAPSLYHMAPGDTVSLSDDLARDPDSGRRGITSRACICISVTHTPSYGHEGVDLFGEVELLFTDEDRTFPMAPAVEVDTDFSGTVDGITFTSGYAAAAAGGPALKTRLHAYSRAADPTDVTRLSDGDLVRIYEIDPANPAAITAWDRTLVASGAVDATDNYVKITADLAAPAYSTTKEYRIVPQTFSSVQDSQKLVAYLAGADELVQDLVDPNRYGEDIVFGFTRTTPDAFPCRLIPDEADDEGRPLHAGLVFDHVANMNALVSYVTAPHTPTIHMNLHSTTATANTIILCFPFFLGMTPTATSRRRLKVSPILSISSAGQTATLTVTSSQFPPRGTVAAKTAFTGPKRSVVFTRTGATTEAAVTEQLLLPVPADVLGVTWITVELKSSGGGATAGFRGFQRLMLGPVEI